MLEGRDLKDTVLVDNASYSFAYQINNGIPIIPFYDSKQDDQLVQLAEYLKELNKAPDVRIFNRDYFKLQKIMKAVTQAQAFQEITK